MSVKGEGGGGGVGDEGERVHVRGRLMRMQREEFSTRHSPPVSPSVLLSVRSGSEGVIPALLLPDGRPGSDYSTPLTGAGLSLLGEGGSGLLFHGCWDQGAALKRGNVRKVERRETKGGGEARAGRRW